MNDIIDRLNAVDFDALVQEAISASKTLIRHGWSSVKEFVKKAAKNVRDSGVAVAKMLAQGAITEEEAKLLMEDERILLRVQLRTIIGMALLTAERVINAIVSAFRDTFNTVMGFELV